MGKTVLITGTSSGIGRATAIAFSKAGWNVAATLRAPEKDRHLEGVSNLKKYALDVTDLTSIAAALQSAKKDFGSVDVVVNNAGYGLDGVFEAMTDESIQKQFDTNVFGLMRVTREAVKLMREQGGGIIVQVSSMGGRVTFPLYSIYHSTKWAVEGFSESLHYELLPFNVRIKIIEPGIIQSEFYGRSREFVKPTYTNVYNDYLAKFEKAAVEAMKNAGQPEIVANEIVKAASDGRSKMRYPIGQPSPLLLRLRKLVPDSWFFGMVKATYKI